MSTIIRSVLEVVEEVLVEKGAESLPVFVADGLFVDVGETLSGDKIWASFVALAGGGATFVVVTGCSVGAWDVCLGRNTIAARAIRKRTEATTAAKRTGRRSARFTAMATSPMLL